MKAKDKNTQFYLNDFLTQCKKKKHRYWTGKILSGYSSYTISITFCDQILSLDLQELLQFKLGNSNKTA